MKRILLIVGVALMVLSGCSKKDGAQARSAGDPNSGNLVVWSFTDELEGLTNNYYKPAHPGVTVEYSLTPTDQFMGKLDPVLSSGQGVPDVFALESDFVRKYVESGLLLDLTDIYEANKSKLLAYPSEIGTYNGKVYGMSWQACPGAMFYRRSLAKKYLGTDDPKVVQTYFSDLNKFLDTARKLKTDSKGSCVVVSSIGDLSKVFYGLRKNPWIVNNKLNIDPAIEQYLDIAKTLHDNRWEGRVGQWSEGWFAGMNGTLRDETGPLEVFSYFLPTWGLHYVLKTNAPATSGDWAMIPGPAGWRWGGTWIGAYKNTKNPAAAKEYIRYLTTDDAFLEQYAKDSGDVVSNLAVVNKIKDNFSEPFLGGQNHYAEFSEMAKNVDGKLVQGTDNTIDAIFMENVTAFVNGEKSKAQALADFRAQTESALGL
jgi:ABC-type glycerol-3-phosphate transport system substrate-binding protein